MLDKLIDALLGRTVNFVAGRLPGGEYGSSKGTRSAAASAPLDEIVLGESIPSPMEALRGGESGPKPVTLTIEERKRHLYLLGATGTGKTNCLIQLLMADVAAGRGVCLLDARGDLVDRALLRLADNYAPAEIADRLLLLDLRSTAPYQTKDEPIVGFNPLTEAGGDAYSRALFTLDALKAQFGSAIGVQTEETLRHSLLVLAMTGGSLLELELLLLSAAYRREALAKVNDASAHRFFTRFEALPETQKAQWVSPCTNKIAPLLARPSLRRVLGMRQGGVSFRTLLDERPDAIALICLGKDELFQASDLLTGFVVSAVSGAVMRSDRTVASRKETTFLYLDEFENAAEGGSRQFESIISEGRRFGLGLVLSHQSTSQLESRLRSLIRNVVGTQLFFAVGGLDAEQLAGEIPSEEPRAILRTLLMKQQIGEALLTRRGQPFQRLRTTLSPDPKVSDQKVAQLRRASLERWGVDRNAVEADIAARDAWFGLAPAPRSIRAFGGPTQPGQSPSPADREISRSAADANAPIAASLDTALDAPGGFEVRDAETDNSTPRKRKKKAQP